MSNAPNETTNPTAPETPPANTGGGTGTSNGGTATPDIAAWGANLEDADLASYLLLRQSIDGFELIALGTYFKATTVEERKQVAEEIADQVLAVKAALGSDGCPAQSVPSGDGKCIPIG